MKVTIIYENTTSKADLKADWGFSALVESNVRKILFDTGADALSFERAFDRQALPMIWDYGEVNPFSDSRGCWDLEPMIEAISHLSQIPPVEVEE